MVAAPGTGTGGGAGVCLGGGVGGAGGRGRERAEREEEGLSGGCLCASLTQGPRSGGPSLSSPPLQCASLR